MQSRLTRSALCVSAILCFMPCTALANSWLCVADHAAGFAHSGDEWSSQLYRPSGKFVLAVIDPSDVDGDYPEPASATYGWRSFDNERFVYAWCPEQQQGIFRCNSLTFSFIFFEDVRRYMFATFAGYADLGRSPAAPYMEIGTCTQL
jgi:hypothetical protein